MKILIVGLNYAPELAGIGKYTGEMAEWLASRGHRVSMIAAPPYYPQWRVSPSYSAWRYRRETIHGVAVTRCPLEVPRRPGLFKRLVHLSSFAITSAPVVFWRAFRDRPDVLIVIQPPLFAAPAALLAARTFGAKAWLHIQDDELQAAFELGFLRLAWLRKMLRAWERVIVGRFDRVSTISQAMLGRLIERGVAPEKRVIFPNWVDTEAIYPLDAPSPLRSELGIAKEKVIVLYAGNMGKKQGLEILLEAARLLRDDPSIHFILSGDGSTRQSLLEKAEGMPNVRFLPLQPAERLNGLLNLADIHLLIERGQSGDAFMPSKVTGMFASGRPVVASIANQGELARIVRSRGVAIEPENPDLLAETISGLAKDTEQRRKMGQEARAYAVSHWNKTTILETFERDLMSCRGLLE